MQIFSRRPEGATGIYMPQSLAKNLIHLVFSSSKRQPVLSEQVRAPLCAYAAGVLRDLDSPAIAINAWRDHVHVLFSLSKNQPLSQVVMEVKRATSKWLKTRGAQFANFHWQAGYGAFSIGQSGVKEATAYIANQPEHHRRKTFQEELSALLKLYELEFDERHLWD
jgi:putative transposase